MDSAASKQAKVDFDKFRDPETGEADFQAYADAQAKALRGLSTADKKKTRDYIKRNFETDLVRDMRELRERIEGIEWRGESYYDTDSGDRAAFREVRPELDAILWITGAGTTTLKTGKARKEVARLLGEMGITMRWQDVPWKLEEEEE